MNTIFNTEIFNYKKISDTKTRTGISFAGFSLTSLECGKNSTGIMVQNLNIFNLNNIEVSTSTSTYADGGNILNKKYSSKTISITLFIQAENYNDLVHHIDILKQRTQISE